MVEEVVKGNSEEEEERAAEAQGGEAVWDEGDGGEKDEVQLCRLSESDVGWGLLLQLSQTQMTAPAPCDKHRSEVQPLLL